MKPVFYITLCSTLCLFACGDAANTPAAPSAASTPPAASAPPAAPVAEAAAASAADTPPAHPAAEAASAAGAAEAPPPEPTQYGADGMHPVCEAYFQRASRCFARAPAEQAAALQQSLAATRAELLPADADTCREIRRQFEDMAQAMDCGEPDDTAKQPAQVLRPAGAT